MRNDTTTTLPKLPVGNVDGNMERTISGFKRSQRRMKSTSTGNSTINYLNRVCPPYNSQTFLVLLLETRLFPKPIPVVYWPWTELQVPLVKVSRTHRALTYASTSQRKSDIRLRKPAQDNHESKYRSRERAPHRPFN